MICPSCGKEIENGSNKCPFCHINISNNQTLDVDAHGVLVRGQMVQRNMK